MPRYHINKHGKATICRATKRVCPLGATGHIEADNHTEALQGFIKMWKKEDKYSNNPEIKTHIKNLKQTIRNRKFYDRDTKRRIRRENRERIKEKRGSRGAIGNILGWNGISYSWPG